MGHITDGTSNTLMIGERPPSQSLVYGWIWAGSGDFPYFGATDVVLGVNERPDTPTNAPDFFRPGKVNDPVTCIAITSGACTLAAVTGHWLTVAYDSSRTRLLVHGLTSLQLQLQFLHRSKLWRLEVVVKLPQRMTSQG